MPARYISSFEDFVNKRKTESTIKVGKTKGDLTRETIEECWRKFQKGNFEEK